MRDTLRRLGVCDVHALVDGDHAPRETQFVRSYRFWVCGVCFIQRTKRAQALLIRAVLEKTRPPEELFKAVRSRSFSPEDEVLLWEAAFGPPDDD